MLPQPHEAKSQIRGVDDEFSRPWSVTFITAPTEVWTDPKISIAKPP